MAAVAAWVLPAAALAAAGIQAARQAAAPLCASDAQLFSAAGHNLVTGRVGQVYAAADNQGGPLELMWSTLTTVNRTACAAQPRSAAIWIALAVTAAAVVCLVMRYVTDTAGPMWRQRVAADAASIAICALVVPVMFRYGHPADLLIPLAWLACARLAANGRHLAAGAVLGVAAGWETWALLGIGLLAAADIGRDRIQAAAVTGIIAAAWYVPFAATGHFAMTHMTWDVWNQTLLGSVIGLTADPWSMRLLQAAACAAVGASIYRRMRETPHAAWAAAAATIICRLLSDPTYYRYYWVIPAIAAAAGLGTLLASTGDKKLSLGAGAAVVVATALARGRTIPGVYVAWGVALVAIVTLAAFTRPTGRTHPQAA